MAHVGPEDAEKQALVVFLDAQRAIVLAIVAGWAEDSLRTPVLPSGWTPLGLVAERHWFQRVAAGSAGDLRGVILHMIEETARHAGHLDIARELTDNRTGLGQRYSRRQSGSD
jgi:hypothetical protein